MQIRVNSRRWSAGALAHAALQSRLETNAIARPRDFMHTTRAATGHRPTIRRPPLPLVRSSACILPGLVLAAFAACAADRSPQVVPAADPTLPPPAGPALEAFSQKLPGSAFSFTMIPVPADPDRGIEAFWIGSTELTWEAFDVFVYRLDEDKDAPQGTDAATRPTKPYLPPDRGFGHEGYAAISMSYKNAAAFCEWLSKKSGRHWRLPTEKEWEYAATAGVNAPYPFGADDALLGEFAWFGANSDGKPHPVAGKTPNAWGIFDCCGNVAEWVDVPGGKPVTKGGNYLSTAPACSVAERAPYDPSWNRSDPQVPKSKWWLSDGPFVGFRVVCDPKPAPPAGAP